MSEVILCMYFANWSYLPYKQEIESSYPTDEEMLDLDEATSPNKLENDTLYELHDQSSDQFQYKCNECHMDMEIAYHCKECNVSTLITGRFSEGAQGPCVPPPPPFWPAHCILS